MRVAKLNIFSANKIKVNELNSQSRDKNILKQLSTSMVLKLLSIGLSLFLVSFLISKLGAEKYGVWSTLLTILQWLSLMDIGIGSGLRNKLSAALAKNRLFEAKRYVSTAYFAMAIFGIGAIIIVTPLFYLFNWNKVFNTQIVSNGELRIVVMTFIYCMIIYVVLALINQILIAVQRNSLTSVILIIGNTLFIILLVVFFHGRPVSLIMTAVLYSSSLLIAILIVSVLFFTEYTYLKPGIKYFKKSKVSSILNLGLKFFLMQIISIIVFCTDNIIISNILGPKLVTVYAVPFLIFNNIGYLMNMLMTPFFASYTEAYTKGDIEWMQKKIELMCKLLIPIIFFILLVVYFCDEIIKIWIKEPIVMPKGLPLLMGVYAIIYTWNNIFAYVLNGIGKLRLSMYLSIVTAVINIPLAIFLTINMKMGLNGIVLSNLICLGLGTITSPIQVYYFIFSKNKNPKYERLLQ
ncbi:hypothetical protein BEL04_06545 [Mucilaginibacter sp. PPCGB 2223]|uniref:lipopolysaccharide biosynthesis protein n=1 Tax=Mucilaginibacter sp. PPCGB 2223 TaxID=1886027 RepID=UPI000824D360|nr:MATE family efflux transporter [Mucilaginibacter sp. PPCGB 2223]OCX53934.1 hypothetical protein BEL04_06545 [Mucilaginibacter sp. PPCGB 2223]